MRVASVFAIVLWVVAGSSSAAPRLPGRYCALDARPQVADLDADGRLERVSISGGRLLGRTSACRYVLHAVGSSHWAVRFRADVPPPTVPAIRSIDRVPGADIAVIVDRGASSAIAEVFTVRGTQLRRMSVRGFGPDRDRLLFFLAAGMSFGGVDCVRGAAGEVVQWTAGRLTKGYHLSEVRFRTVGLAFRPVARREVDVARPPNLGTGFARCPRRGP